MDIVRFEQREPFTTRDGGTEPLVLLCCCSPPYSDGDTVM